MQDIQVGLIQAIQAAQDFRENVGAQDVTVHWPTPFGEVSLIADADGHQLFVAGEPVPMRSDA